MRYDVARLMWGLWADVHECRLEDCKTHVSLFHGDEHVLDVSVFMRHDRTVDVQAMKQGIQFCQEVTSWDRDAAMACMLTVLHVWKYRLQDEMKFRPTYERIYRTISGDPPNGTGSVSPSLCLLLDMAEARHSEVTGELGEQVRRRLAESMRWLREHEGLGEKGLLRIWREEIVKEVLED